MADDVLSRARVLVVDDEPSNVRLLERLLQQAGCAEVQSTTDPRKVVGLVEVWGPDLILLDLRMPHMDGLAVLGALRAKVQADDFLPVLVLTADVTEEARQRVLEAGAKDFVTKPFDHAEVLQRARNLLETRFLYRELRRQNEALEETVRARTEALSASEASYRTLVENQTDLIVRFLPDTTLTFVNDVCCRYFGARREDLIGRPFLAVLPEESRSSLMARLASLTPETPSGSGEQPYRAADGRVRWVQWANRALFDEAGRAVEIHGVGRDITALKEAQGRLELQFAVTRILAESSGDAQATITSVLEAVGESLGWEIAGLWTVDAAEQVLRRANIWYAPHPPEVREFATASAAQTFGPGRGLVGRVWASGEPLWIEDVTADPQFVRRDLAARAGLRAGFAFPVRSTAGVIGVLAVFRRAAWALDPNLLALTDDIGVRIGLFLARRRTQEELRRQQETLFQSEKLAAMGQLLAGVAHELNNPLSVVLGRAAILRAALARSPLQGQVQKIDQAAQRCARIVKNFLALARQRPPERRTVQLNDVAREAVELLAYQLRVDDVQVEFDLADSLPTLWADPNQLHQVVVNLVSNARDAMRQTPPPRRLTLTSRSDAAQGLVSLIIADTGPGIPPEVQRRLFEPFFTTKPPGQGTGLGLSLCRGIVEGHRGTIRVESAPGRGAVFTVELPVERPSGPEAQGDTGEAVAPVSGKMILVVDDEDEMVSLLAEMLTADGNTVETADNGATALDRLRARRYDLVLTDVRMPVLDGLGLYRELEQRDPEMCRRVVFVTGDTLSADVDEFLARTAAPTLHKPFTAEEVRQAIGRVLGGPAPHGGS